MKKRVLSLLLMLAMVISVAPMFIVPTSAAETEEEAEFNYDSLYYKDGLVFAIDFFKSNVFWDPEGDDYAQPVSPIYNSAYLHSDGKTYDFTVPANRLTADGTALNEAYLAAIKAWGGTSGTDRTFLKQFVTTASNGTYAFSWAPNKQTPDFAAAFVSAYILKDGYILLNADMHSSAGFQLGAFNATGAFTDATAMQVVYDRGVPGKNQNPQFIWHNFRPSFNTDGTLTKVADGADTFALAEGGLVVERNIEFSGIMNLVLSQTGAATEGGTDDTFSIWDGNGVYASATGTYTGNNNFKGTVYFGWSETMDNGKIYSIRQYNKGLTLDAYKQNTFANLCKWYKLDMGIFNTLTGTQVERLRNVILPFAEEKGITVGGDAEDRAILQEKLTAEMLDVAYSDLTLDDNSAAALAFKEIAMGVMADIGGILALPAAYRSMVYVAVNGMTASQKQNKAAVQEMIDSTVDMVLEVYYGQYINKSELTYKDLYVRQENLFLWMDFFAARETDGTLYMEYSYSDVGTTASGGPLPAGYTKNWDLPKYKDGDSKKGLNPDRIFIAQESGEAEARLKYIYKGGNYFTFADIADAKWGHSNIRTWGNGSLICGKNNSFNVKSPGVDKEQVTYQFVTGWENDGGKAADSMNVQLDGFRMDFAMDAGGVEGMFNVTNYTYYGYGVSTDSYTLSNSALMNAKPGKSALSVGSAMDLTLTLDKFIGDDDGHYFIEKYKTNADGAVEYLESDVKPIALNLSTYARIYRYKIDGAWYYLRVTGSGENATYVARYAETMAEKPKYLVDAEGYRANSVPVIVEDGVMKLDWANADYGSEKVLDNGALADTVYGPCYVNPFEEVPFGTVGATGPITYYGTYDMGVYANGTQFFYTSGLSYQRSDIGWVGNGGNMTFYAVRTYDCVLTEDEIRQNHFADLAGYYGLDLTPYSLLSESERLSLHADLASLQLGLAYEDGIAAYEAAIAEYLYAFDTYGFSADELALADNFLALCYNFGLDTRELKELSPESLLRIFNLFADVDPNGRSHTPVLQKAVADAVKVEIEDHYAAAYGHKSINFEGWQVKKDGDFGLRALYSTDLSRLPALEAADARVMTGVLVAKHGVVSKVDDLKITVDENGEVVVPEGVTLVKGYWDGQLGETAKKTGSTLYFTHDVILDVEDPDDLYAVADLLESERYYFLGFTALVVGEGEEQTASIFYDEATADGKGGAQSVFSLSRIAKKYKMSEVNIQKAMNICEEESFIEITVAGQSLSKYQLVISPSKADADGVQSIIEAAMGFKLDEVRAADAAGKSGYVYINSIDNTYADDCYGMTVVGGNLYLWCNADAEYADACALFNDYVLQCIMDGSNVVFEDGLEVVCRAKPAVD